MKNFTEEQHKKWLEANKKRPIKLAAMLVVVVDAAVVAEEDAVVTTVVMATATALPGVATMTMMEKLRGSTRKPETFSAFTGVRPRPPLTGSSNRFPGR